MKSWTGKAGLALSALALAFLPAGLAAQGTTTAAVQGTVLQPGGAPVAGATISVVNGSTGIRYAAVTRDNGRFNVENVAVGGPYTIEARAIGFQVGRQTGVQLALGQRYNATFSLQQAVVEVQDITVNSTAGNPLINENRTGAQGSVSSAAIENLPILGRNFTDLVVTVPQVSSVSSGVSIGGQNNRFNNIQIDGGVNNDVFGLSASGTPGGSSRAKPISIEAVDEFQVLIAPYDVRQGSFSGGLINAVTKSGSNVFHGSAFGYLQDDALVGKDTAGAEPTDFNTKQYGFSLGGPLVRDRLHFFVATDIQSRTAPWSGQQIGADAAGGNDSVGVGITQARANAVTQILRDQYGFDPGTFDAPGLSTPDRNVFAKLTGQLGVNSQLELSFNYVNASEDNLIRSSTATGNRDGYQLSNSGYNITNRTNTLRGKWTAVFGRVNNEFIGGFQTIRDERELPNRVPLIFVAGDRAGTNIAAGAERFSHLNKLDQDIFELTDNLTFDVGAHRLTVGTHNEFFKFRNVFFGGSLGIWNFSSPDSLLNGLANRYEIALPGALRPEGPIADFKVQQYGFYLQDSWSPSNRLTLTAGLRADIPVMPSPVTNEALLAELGINTSVFPSSNTLWSPRFGFNADVTGSGRTIVRGGAGIFSGRPPYVWLSNAFTGTGLEQATLICTGAAVPTFTIDVDAAPTTCAGGGAAVPPIASISFFDENFKYPQNMKLSLGLDHEIGAGIVATVDFLYTKSRNQFVFEDVNLNEGTTRNNEGRLMYGTVSGSGSATPSRVTSNYRNIILHRNENEDYSTAMTFQLQKRFSNGFEFNTGYTYSKTEDLMSLTSSQSASNLQNTTLDGSLFARNRRRSVFDRPHKITVSGTVAAPFKTMFSLFYVGVSGAPYTYTTNGDANADGLNGNDIVYVPRDESDIIMAGATPEIRAERYATLDQYISGEACLREQRGQILVRNTCRNPWQSFVNARLAKTIPTVGGQALEITADLFNLFSFLGSDWGNVRSTAPFEGQNLLRLTGYDAASGRGIYDLALPSRKRVQTQDSRWKAQLGVRYTF